MPVIRECVAMTDPAWSNGAISKLCAWLKASVTEFNSSKPHSLTRVSRVSSPQVEVMKAFIPSWNKPSPCWFVETATLAGPS